MVHAPARPGRPRRRLLSRPLRPCRLLPAGVRVPPRRALIGEWPQGHWVLPPVLVRALFPCRSAHRARSPLPPPLLLSSSFPSSPSGEDDDADADAGSCHHHRLHYLVTTHVYMGVWHALLLPPPPAPRHSLPYVNLGSAHVYPHPSTTPHPSYLSSHPRIHIIIIPFSRFPTPRILRTPYAHPMHPPPSPHPVPLQ